MKAKMLAVAFLAAGSMFAGTRFSIGVSVGAPAATYYSAPPSYAVQPPCPGPGYTWSAGYWTQGPRRTWVQGQWRRDRNFRERDFRGQDFRNGRRDFDRDRRFDNGYRGTNQGDFKQGNIFGTGVRVR